MQTFLLYNRHRDTWDIKLYFLKRYIKAFYKNLYLHGAFFIDSFLHVFFACNHYQLINIIILPILLFCYLSCLFQSCLIMRSCQLVCCVSFVVVHWFLCSLQHCCYRFIKIRHVFILVAFVLCIYLAEKEHYYYYICKHIRNYAPIRNIDSSYTLLSLKEVRIICHIFVSWKYYVNMLFFLFTDFIKN